MVPSNRSLVIPAYAQQRMDSAVKTKTVTYPPSRSLEHINNEANSHHVFRPTTTLMLASTNPSADSNIVNLEDSDDEQSVNSEALLHQFRGQSVQSLKQQAPSIRLAPKQTHPPNSTAARSLTSSSSSSIPGPSSSKERASPSKSIPPTPRTTKKRTRVFTRKPTTPKPAQEEDDWYIERVVGHREPSYPSPFYWEYLVKWKDHPHEESTWQSEDSLLGADEILKNYRARVAVEGAGPYGKSWVRSVVGSSGGEDDGSEMSM